MQYAPDGWAFFSVDTPAAFCEYLLPSLPEDDQPETALLRRDLEEMAEHHATHITRSDHRRG